MEIKDKFLPIGTVVMLKGGEKKVMIISYLTFPTGQDENRNIYDYGGCVFPEGIIDSKVGIGFNHGDIDEVFHYGLEDDESRDLNKLLRENAEQVKAEYNKAIKEGREVA